MHDQISYSKAIVRLKVARGCLTANRQRLEIPTSGTRRFSRSPVRVSGTLKFKYSSCSACGAMADNRAQASSTDHVDNEVVYDVVLFVRGDVKLEENSRLWLTVVSEEDSSLTSPRSDISSFRTVPYKIDQPNKSGTNFSGQVNLPASLKPGVVVLMVEQAEAASPPRPFFLRKLTLRAVGAHQESEFLCNSYIDPSHGDRFVFPAKSYTPASTPAGILDFRKRDLEAHRGTDEEQGLLRKGAHRIYAFDVYNDLGKPLAGPGKERPTLGGPQMPFPRRIRTNRGLDDKGFEKRIPDEAGKLPWVPIDERFTLIKERTFSGLSMYSTGAVASSPHGFVHSVIGLPTVQKKLSTSEFRSLNDIDEMFKDHEKTHRATASAGSLRATSETDVVNSLAKKLDEIGDDLRDRVLSRLPKILKRTQGFRGGKEPAVDPAEEEGSLPKEEAVVLSVVQFLSGIIHRWPAPNVWKDRQDLWHTDEDFGRQVMEGQNPLAVRAMTEEDLRNFKVIDQDVDGLLEGSSLSARVSEGHRMYVLDFHTHFVEFVSRANDQGHPGPTGSPRVLYAGRCILYSRNDKALVPIAIELETEGVPLTVYTPRHSTQLWRLAKSVMASLEIWHHQSVVHLLQTHLVVEPYIIATRRSLSTMHPINKLLQPAFRWTMRPNADARQNLISADGVLEKAFTAGTFSMQLISRIYDKEWRFDTQSLPNDLLFRGVARRGRQGLEVMLPGYSYAEDALLIYEAMEEWIRGYVALYYDDSVAGQKVTEDPELVAWWQCVRSEGHPDKMEGWPQLTDTASLVTILATILWTTGPHHAAVNYGQYQYSGYMPNRPSMIRKKIPLPGSEEERALEEDFEGKLMELISDPLSTATIMLMTKLLSHHSADEEFINSPEHSWIKDPAALKLYQHYVNRLGAAEAMMERRNQTAARLRGGKGFPYTQMMPSVDTSTVEPGEDGDIGYQVSYRGIPNSIAI